jgi:uncharacterized coiled-coil DUF342 family protein
VLFTSQNAASMAAKAHAAHGRLSHLDAQIRRRRSEVSRLQVELKDLDDYLDVLEARRRAVGKRTHTQAQMEKRYRVK